MSGQELFEKNKMFLQEKDKNLKACFNSFFFELSESEEVIDYVTYDNQIGICLKREDGVVQLNSQYEALGFATEWAEYIIKTNNISWKSVIILFGLGNGSYVRALIEHMPEETHLLIYEPEKAVFVKLMNLLDFEELLGDKADVIVDGLNWEYFGVHWQKHVNIKNMSKVHILSSPGYSRIFRKEFKQLHQQILTEYQSMRGNWNTTVSFAENAAKNQIAKLPYFAKTYSLVELLESLPNDYPAIVVAAGPSLKKNIHELKRAKNKALIIAIDSSLKHLLEADIVPDIYVTIDARKPLELFENERIPDIPVCVTSWSVPQVLEQQRNKIFFSADDCYLRTLYKEVNQSFAFLSTGGTVAHNAFYLAVAAAMNPIILVGQDLAFTGDKTHAEGTYNKSKDISEKKTIWVEDIEGNPIRTEFNLKVYKEWYEEAALKFPAYHIIDATEGGAKIEGTEIRDLRSAIDEFCDREFDYTELIRNISPSFSEAERVIIEERMRNIPRVMETMQKKSVLGKEKYERVLTLIGRGNIDLKEVKKIMKELGVINKEIEKKDEYLLIEPYIAASLREVLAGLANENEDFKEDIRNTSERGKKIMAAIDEAISTLLPYVEEVLKTI